MAPVAPAGFTWSKIFPDVGDTELGAEDSGVAVDPAGGFTLSKILG
ncbi:MAG: hypothetical protein WBM24_18245 [Candidatus Sulfotelmatobacter sp.]